MGVCAMITPHDRGERADEVPKSLPARGAPRELLERADGRPLVCLGIASQRAMAHGTG